MAPKCAYRGGTATVAPHNGTDVNYAFDTYQCAECGGYSNLDGSPTVPTSALEVGATYDGPGAELIADPNTPPHRARDMIR